MVFDTASEPAGSENTPAPFLGILRSPLPFSGSVCYPVKMPFKNPHPLYQTWADMRGRCRNPNNVGWADYGGRGISVCERWDSFHAFIEDMGERPAGFSLDRIDVNGNYEPSNCRWASRTTQNLNRRAAKFVDIGGVQYRAYDLAKLSGLKADTVIERAAKGLTYEQVIDPIRRKSIDGLAIGGLANGARQRARTHCKRGHEFTPENTYVSKQGFRQCRECHNAKMRRRSLAARS